MVREDTNLDAYQQGSQTLIKMDAEDAWTQTAHSKKSTTRKIKCAPCSKQAINTGMATEGDTCCQTSNYRIGEYVNGVFDDVTRPVLCLVFSMVTTASASTSTEYSMMLPTLYCAWCSLW